MTRAHPITGDPILFAPHRAERPIQDQAQRCPFCAGHESDTPPEIARVGEPWRVRVFPNKYPPVDGAEVIVEAAEHGATFDRIECADDVVRMYLERYRANGDAAYVALFKNEGARAGASIPHMHSQLIPLPFTPPRIARELDAFARAAQCPMCNIEGDVIRENETMRWIAPAGSSLPYQSWLVPRRHICEFTDDEVSDVASLLRDAARAMQKITDAYNWIFVQFPRANAAHCYIELFPRLAQIAGFELGTGTFVEIIDPAHAAERLRD
jgi:UDPglucose--hexose-1-phosphate uridylyltransferase